MDKIIASPKLKDDPIARVFIESIEERQEELSLEDSLLYYDFPVFRDYEDELYRPSVMLISRHHGIIILNLLEASRIKEEPELIYDEDEKLSQLFSIFYGALLKSKRIRVGQRNLSIPINCFFYVPGFDHVASLGQDLESEILTSFEAFEEKLLELKVSEIPTEILEEVRSIVEGAKAFRAKPRTRRITEKDKKRKAGTLAQLEEEINNFDANQRKVAITLIDGPQRIKGLAGSGKTIVLAMKAAHIHLTYPEKKILFTFYTRSLYYFIRQLITKFYKHYKSSEPDWSMLHVRHAWGGSTIEGVYYEACIDNGVKPIRYSEAIGKGSDPFDYVCNKLLERAMIRPKYDYVIIDEGQDFPPSFYQLCYFLAQGEADNKSIIWAYDELQNIFDVKLKSTRELFGVDENGQPLVDLERAAKNLPTYLSNDVVLYKCYRNPLEILICSHALGFGIYGETIVQMLENKEHWEDVGYKVIKGEFVEGSDTIIERPKENSPLSISQYQSKEDLIKYYSANSLNDEINWVCKEILAFLEEGLLPNDILVISLDDRNARRYFKLLGQTLLENGVEVNDILSSPFGHVQFWLEDKVTLSTVYRAKGNEAALVLAIGIDAIYHDRNNRIGRNRLFTAFTRSKAWLRISGIGEYAKTFFAEIEKALEYCPQLRFIFPNPKQVELLQRDLTARARKLRALKDRYRKELEKLGLKEEELFDFFSVENKK